LKPFWKPILTKPQIEASTATAVQAILSHICAIVMHVVNRQKHRLSLTAAFASVSAVCGEYLLSAPGMIALGLG
jgi:hypothetical protein